MDSGSSLRATFNLLRALTAKPLFRKYSACFRYNEYGIVSSSSHASKPDFLISPLRSPDPPSASSTTEIPLCLSIYWISSSDLQFSLFLQKVWLKIFLKFPILLCLAFQILLNLLELLTDSLNWHLVDYEIDVQLKTIQGFYRIELLMKYFIHDCWWQQNNSKCHANLTNFLTSQFMNQSFLRTEVPPNIVKLRV